MFTDLYAKKGAFICKQLSVAEYDDDNAAAAASASNSQEHNKLYLKISHSVICTRNILQHVVPLLILSSSVCKQSAQWLTQQHGHSVLCASTLLSHFFPLNLMCLCFFFHSSVHVPALNQCSIFFHLSSDFFTHACQPNWKHTFFMREIKINTNHIYFFSAYKLNK